VLVIVDAANAPTTSTPAAAIDAMIFFIVFLLWLNITPVGCQSTL